MKTPSAVATPLPPLNPSHTGKQCPNNAAIPASIMPWRCDRETRGEPHGQRTLGRVKQRENAGKRSRHARDIRCANIAAAVLPHIFPAEEPRQNQPKRNGCQADIRRAQQSQLFGIPDIETLASVTKGNECKVVYSAPVDFSLLSMR